MNRASQGLRLTAARPAIAEMSAAEILADLSDQQKADLSAVLPRPAASAAPAPANAEGMKPKKAGCADEDDDSTEVKPATASLATATAIDAVAAARAAELQRIADVFASDAVKGREQAAAALLAETDMSAAAITAFLPKTAQAATADDGKAMLDAMREGAGADLGQGGESEAAAEANHGWDKIHDEIRAARR